MGGKVVGIEDAREGVFKKPFTSFKNTQGKKTTQGILRKVLFHVN